LVHNEAAVKSTNNTGNKTESKTKLSRCKPLRN